jgi:Glutathione S-transferase, N-terminal domain
LASISKAGGFHSPSANSTRPEYLALNPDGKVPTLLVDGHPLTEVAATLYYLAKRYPAAGLFPVGDLDAEAQIISWMSFIASTVHPARRIGVERWKECSKSPKRAWRDGSGRSPAIRSPTFISFASFGDFLQRFIPLPTLTPASMPITSA